MLSLVPSVTDAPLVLGADPRALELERLDAAELALRARAVGEHLPVEDLLRLEALRRRRRELESA